MSLPPKKSPVEPSPESVKAGHEVSDVSIRGILLFIIALVVVAVVIHVALWIMHQRFLKREREDDPAPLPLASQREPPPGPGFEETPGVQLREYRAEQMRRIDSSGWDDRGAHIAIDDAIRRVLDDGTISSRPGAKSFAELKQQERGVRVQPTGGAADEARIVPGSGKSSTAGETHRKVAPATDPEKDTTPITPETGEAPERADP